MVSIVALSIISCSKDDSLVETSSESVILPKRIVETTTNTNTTNIITSTLKYNGNKLLEINYPDEKILLTYTGDLITKIVSYRRATILFTTEYQYENNKLKTVINTEDSNPSFISKTKTIYIHNTDGTILEEEYNINSTTGIETKTNRSSLNTYANGNLVKTIYTAIYTSTTTDSNITTINYEYDVKNNPYKNILGFSQLLDSLQFLINLNNATKRTSFSQSTTNGTVNPPSTPTFTNYTFLYNSNNYATEEKYNFSTFSNNVETIKTITTQYFYE